MPTVVAVRVEGGSSHRHLVAVSCRAAGSTRTERRAVEDLIPWVRAGGELRCRHWRGEGRVLVDTAHGAPVLRAWRDGGWVDDLLDLPRFEEDAPGDVLADPWRTLRDGIARVVGAVRGGGATHLG